MTDAKAKSLKLQGVCTYRSLIANLVASDAAPMPKASVDTETRPATPTPLSFGARTKAEHDPRGAIPRQYSLPLCVRPYLISGPKAVAA